jgi:hypothetical protein
VASRGAVNAPIPMSRRHDEKLKVGGRNGHTISAVSNTHFRRFVERANVPVTLRVLRYLSVCARTIDR